MANEKQEKKTPEIDVDAMVDNHVQKALKALEQFMDMTQEQVDKIVEAMTVADQENHTRLAKMAVEETGRGVYEDKIIKNMFATEYIWHSIKNEKTVGIVEENELEGYVEIAEPVGVVAAATPVTNPTSTTMFKSLICMKSRNPVIFGFHPSAQQCSVEAAKVLYDAAVKAGAPENCIQWIETPSIQATTALMNHPGVSLILATGGAGMVRSAYSAGKPALGVGPGNVPAVIDETAEVKPAVSSVLISKTFDNGMICASEQSVVVVKDVYEEVKKEFVLRGAYILSKAEKDKVAATIIKDGRLNAAIVGQPAYKIAAMAGLEVPEDTKVLIGEVTDICEEEAFAHEKLSPVLAMYKAKDFDDAVQKAYDLVDFGGAGHTSVLYTDDRFPERIEAFSLKLHTSRILINSPSSQGGIGDLYNFRLNPSLTLGCGSWGGNAVSENVGPQHLLNIKTVAERRENMLWYKVPAKVYFKRGALDLALRELQGKKRAFIVTDRFLFNSGMTNAITATLDDIGVDYQIFFDVKPDPTLSTINDAMMMVNAYEPDVFIALGGGSSMDAAKILWLMYEQPDTVFEDIAMRFMDIRKRICQIPSLGQKAEMVCVPTTSGTGSEVTPFAIITDDQSGVKYAIADYALTPNVAIIDPNLVDTMPKGLTSVSGYDAITHAIEAYVSAMATNFTNSNSLEALKLLFRYLKRSYDNGAKDPIAREKVHYASTIAGMAFANAFLGVCHSMAHKLGAMFHVPHGLANALLINQVIKFNATDKPVKQTAFPQYKFPCAKAKYGQIADELGLGGKNDDEKVELLQKALIQMKKDLNLPMSIKEFGIDEQEFLSKLDEMVELAFDDQCTGANPRYPLFSEIKQMYLDAYYGVL